jgi:hypothetical protein
MGLVDDAVRPPGERPLVAPPGECRVDQDAFRHAARAVTPVEGEILARGSDAIAEMGIAPGQFAMKKLGVGIDQQLVRIEAMAVGRVVRAMHPVAVKQSGPGILEITMPDCIAVLRQLDALDLPLARGIEKAKLHLLRMGGKDREVRALAIPCRAQRIRHAALDTR